MKIPEIFKKPIVIAILAFVIGLVIGLVVLGWGLWPVQWTDADPSFLRADLQEDYLRMTIDSYVRNGGGVLSTNANDALTLQRFKALGETGPALLEKIKGDYPDQNAIANFSKVIQVEPVPAATAQPAAQPTGKVSGFSVFLIIAVSLLVLGILGFAVIKYLLPLIRQPKEESLISKAREFSNQAAMTDYSATGADQPISQFMTTYVLGDDLFDDSFSIDSPSGEFLGECGIGISETVGVGEPKKVTAFEVWLFDKNDIQTVTKVLMSAHAFNDMPTFQRLQAKGEPIQVERGKAVILETAALQLVATPADVEYGQGALPENSYFERITLEIAVFQKAPSPVV
jgi:hypothetical protein